MPRIGEAGRKSERKQALRLGGRQTAASGAVGDKGDISLDGWLVECKATERGSYGVSHSNVAKIAEEAFNQGRKPAFAISFVNARGEPLRHGAWVAIPEALFKELMERADAE